MAWPTWIRPAVAPPDPPVVTGESPANVSIFSPLQDSPAAESVHRSAILLNVEGLSEEKLPRLESVLTAFELAGLTETHCPHSTFGVPGWAVFAEPRKVKKRNGECHGGVALLLRGAFLAGLVRRLGSAERVPPETVALELKGSVFGCAKNVIVIVAYATRPGGSDGIYAAYVQRYGQSILNLLNDFVIWCRGQFFEVLVLGDFNAYTCSQLGWNGNDRLYTDKCDRTYTRISKCKHKHIDRNGHDLLELCMASELRILNGLRSSDNTLQCDESITREPRGKKGNVDSGGSSDAYVRPGRFALRPRFWDSAVLLWAKLAEFASTRRGPVGGSVLDYFLVSAGLLSACEKLTVAPREELLSDHSPVCVSWRVEPRDVQSHQSSVVEQSRQPKILGWRFCGKFDNEHSAAATLELSQDPEVSQILPTLAQSGPTAAFRLLHTIVRECWSRAGVPSALKGGAQAHPLRASQSSQPTQEDWFDSELQEALTAWKKLRRIAKPDAAAKRRTSIARSRYRRMRKEKLRQWELRCSRFGADLSRVNHVNAWSRIQSFRENGGGAQCLCSAEVQRDQYAEIGQPRHNPDFDMERLRVAEGWLAEFLEQQRGVGEDGGDAFQSRALKVAYKRLRECSAGIDGMTKRWAKPVVSGLLTEVAQIFKQVYSSGTAISDWVLSIVVSIKKKGVSLTDMDNFRGIHVLQFFRQWYAMCLVPQLENLCTRVVPEEQQGFLKGRRIYASMLALYALIEAHRHSNEKLYIAFVDVRKAFPTVRRELLYWKLSHMGASDSLVRALWALYHEAQGTVRGPDGYGDPFDIRVGTREGGVESPLLYILFVCDVIERLNATDIQGTAPLLDGRPIRALQLADDLAIIAKTPEDLERLLRAWARYCDENHVETQTKKTEVLVVTREDDNDSVVVEDSYVQRLRAKLGRTILADIPFHFKKSELKVVESFSYLGTLYHWKFGATAAWENRAGTALKAYGALVGALFLVPLLPMARLIEVVLAIVGGVYWYGAEVWAPFIPHLGSTPGSRVSRKVVAYLLGLHHTRIDRCRGWIKLRELDIDAESRALRVVLEATQHGGLLARAVRQLHTNFETAGRSAKHTWMGKLYQRVRRVWPGFSVQRDTLAITGIPARTGGVKLQRRYADEAELALWRVRQAKLLRTPPTQFQHDVFLYSLLRKLNGNSTDSISEVIFPTLPTVPAQEFQQLLQFLSGLGDFARTNAHRSRRHNLPFLRRSLQDMTRLCLHCCLNRNMPHHKSPDTEWHAFFSCHIASRARKRFILALESSGTGISFGEHWGPLTNANAPNLRTPNVSDLAELVLQCRKNGNLVGDLARFVTDITRIRQRFHRRLTARDFSSYWTQETAESST